MYRFSFIVLILALATYLFSPKNKITQNSERPLIAASEVKGKQALQSETITNKEWGALIEAEYRAIEAEMVLARATERSSARASIDLAEDKPTEKVTVAHIPSSAPVNEIDPALTKFSLFDLKSVAQTELARLGCYTAKIDGLWGPKSRGAVRKFNKHTGGNWDSKPSVKLISTLRSAPDNLCETRCSLEEEGGTCPVTSANAQADRAKKVANTENTENTDSYLPPWMTGGKLASTDPDALVSQPIAPDLRNRDTKRQVRKKAAKRRVKKSRYVARHERRKRSSNWGIKNWPGTSH